MFHKESTQLSGVFVEAKACIVGATPSLLRNPRRTRIISEIVVYNQGLRADEAACLEVSF